MRFRSKFVVLLLILSTLVVGCVTTNTESVINPDFQGDYYQRILVAAFLSDIGSQKTVENQVVEKLQAYGIKAVPSYTFFFRGDELTDKQKIKKIQSAGFDAILTIKFTDSYTTDVYVPQNTYTSSNVYGTPYGFNYKQSTYQSGGYYLSQPNFKINSQLQETKKYRVVWTSDSDSHGCEICDFSRIMGSFADSVVTKMADDGILGELPKPTPKPKESTTFKPNVLKNLAVKRPTPISDKKFKSDDDSSDE